MNEQDILTLIKNDSWMMEVLGIARSLGLPDWMIGAGFVRNKMWDHLHGYTDRTPLADIDLVYYDPDGNDEKTDEALSERFREETGLVWEIVNEYYAHVWNDLPPYTSTEDAISKWPETVTAIGVTLEEDGTLRLIAPYGVDDIINMVIRPTPSFANKIDIIKERVRKKQWLEKWPKLKISV
jgi:hypothetical protein